MLKNLLIPAVAAISLFVSGLSAQCPNLPESEIPTVPVPLGFQYQAGHLYSSPGIAFYYVGVPFAGGQGYPIACTPAFSVVPCCWYGAPLGFLYAQTSNGVLYMPTPWFVPNNPSLAGAHIVSHYGVIQPTSVVDFATLRYRLVDLAAN